MNNITLRLKMICEHCGSNNEFAHMFNIGILHTLYDEDVAICDISSTMLRCAKCDGALRIDNIQLIYEGQE